MTSLSLSRVLCHESVMWCVCVCVCVCDTNSFQPGSQIDLSAFSAPFFGIFDVSQRTCSQNQCLVPLALLSICVPPSCHVQLLFRCLDLVGTKHWLSTAGHGKHHQLLGVVCWLLIVPATCECISGTDLLRQFYVLPHWDRSCRSNFPSHPVTVYWHRADQSQSWPYNARRLAG